MFFILGAGPHPDGKILKRRLLHTDGFVQFRVFIAVLSLIQSRTIIPIPVIIMDQYLRKRNNKNHKCFNQI